MASFLLTSCVAPCGYNDEPVAEPFVVDYDKAEYKADNAARATTTETTKNNDVLVVDSSHSNSSTLKDYQQHHPPPRPTRTGSTKSSHSSNSSSNNNNNIDDERMMRRALASRRQQGYDGGSPVVRSRSQERSRENNNTVTADETTMMESFVDAVQNQNNNNDDYPKDASTDNDSGDGGFDDYDEDNNGGEFSSSPPPKRTSTTGGAATTTNNNNAPISNNYSQRGIHHRAMSDPFDTQEMKSSLRNVLQKDDDAEFAEAVMGPPPPMAVSKQAYPTLLRFPVAETRNKNCWSEPPVSTFTVRGPHYFEDKKKQTSAPYLLTARGSDIFLFGDQPVNLQERSHLILGGHLRSVPTLMINFQFPWGVMVLYFEVPAKLAPYLVADQNSAPPLAPDLNHAERTLAKWFLGDEDYKNDRLKLIPYVVEGPWVVRNMVTGRPAIIGRKLPVSYRMLPESTTHIGTTGHVHTAAPLCECTLDIGSSSATAKRIVSVCRRYMSGLTSDIGFVIQAESPDELPEQMLGSIRVHGPDPLKAPKI